ncbi:hypothetical protein D3C85_1443920 [compost metagenome]
MAVLIVGRALAGVGQHFVGLVGLFEFILGLLVPRIAVRVVFHRQSAIGLLQLGLAGASLDTEDFVKVTFSHSFLHSRIHQPQTRQRGSKLPRGGSGVRGL